MFDFVFVLAIIVVVVVPVALFMEFCEWARREHRVPFFVKWYLDWNKAEGERRLKRAKSRQ